MTDQRLESRIDSVMVFRRAALVTRVAELERGGNGFPTSVRVPGLPLVADDQSVRLRIEAADGSDPGAPAHLPLARDLRIGLEPAEPSGEAKPAPEERELREAEKRVAHLQARVARAEREAARLACLDLPERPEGPEGTPPSPSPTT